MNNLIELLLSIGFVLILILFFGSIGLMVYEGIFITNPQNDAFCLEQGFSDWQYAGDVTGVSGSIVCIEKGNLKYFTFEDGKYYNVKVGVGE